MAAIAAFLAPILAYLAANGLALAWKLVPPATLAIVALVEYSTGSIWTKLAMGLLVLNTTIVTLDVAGKLPTPTPTLPTLPT